MDVASTNPAEQNLERIASALFAGAVAYAAYTYLRGGAAQPTLTAYSAGAFAFAYLLCTRALANVGAGAPHFAVPVFDVRELETEEPDELILTDADRYIGDKAAGDEPLVLDDILTEIGPDARVVRLFDRKAMPTPGQLKSRIDDHIDRVSSPSAPPDASQALSEALAELRRSLR
jgi:hypothetical protein